MTTQRLSWALVAALLASCAGYGAPDEVLFGEAVYTAPAPTFNSASVSTYYLDPQWSVVEDDQSTKEPIPGSIVNAIVDNMDALGYTRLQGTGDPLVDIVTLRPDAGLRVSILKGTGAVYYPGYWCDYWYYYSCYYDYYYAGSYKFGTVILELADLSALPPDPIANPPTEPIDILWTSAVYGVATTPVADEQRIANGINRAFAQSPYLAR